LLPFVLIAAPEGAEALELGDFAVPSATTVNRP
jgi:hypothetical protein